MIVDLSAIADNFRSLSNRLAPAICYAVLKNNAFGVGLSPVAQMLYQQGCRHFIVGYIDEGIELCQALNNCSESHIYVQDGYLPGTESDYQKHQLIPILTDLEQVERCKANGGICALYVDSDRLSFGLTLEECQSFGADGLDVRLILSQMVYNYDENLAFSFAQRRKFEAAVKMLPQAPAVLGRTGIAFLNREFHFDGVAAGVGLFGGNPTSISPCPLVESIYLYARLYQVQSLKKGETVGYSRTYVADSNRLIATLTIGYMAGYPCVLTNKGSVMFGDYKAPVVGRISMDLLTVDVTDVPEKELEIGRWCQVVGPANSLSYLAEQSWLSPGAVLSSFGRQFDKIYVECKND